MRDDRATWTPTWQVVVAAKVGPVSARFTGTHAARRPRSADGYTLKFEGQGGAAGFANGEAKVSLAPAENDARRAAPTR